MLINDLNYNLEYILILKLHVSQTYVSQTKNIRSNQWISAVNNTMSAQNGGCGGYCYQDVWLRGRDTSRSTTLLEWPDVMLDAGRIIRTRYV